MKRTCHTLCLASITLPLCVALVLSMVPVFFLDRFVFYVYTAVVLLLLTLTVWRHRRIHSTVRRYLGAVADMLNPEQKNALDATPLPVVLLAEDRTVVWYNARFCREVLRGTDMYGEGIQKRFEGLTENALQQEYLPCVHDGEQTYAVYVSPLSHEQMTGYVLYFADNTELTHISTEYANSRPVVFSIYIDNDAEVAKELRESERARLLSRVEELLEDWVASFAGVFRKCASGRFFALIEYRHFDSILASRFNILDRVRALRTESGASMTLSIGVGVGTSALEAEIQSYQSLDMALGRGGDQVAVKTENGYDFYGGVSKNIQKHTKVRTRVMASALADSIRNSDKVLLMGHRYSDLDCLGSCAALTEMCRHLGKTAYTIVDRKTTLADVLIQHYEQAGKTDVFITEEEALPLLTEHTLLIITDTHQADRLDAPSLYQKSRTVVVIDHHRKMVDHIRDTTLFYHEPHAGSASEMVAELTQYLSNARLSTVSAEALLAGIMLDTRGFVLNAGVRTFEAAAYLRRMGADTVTVKQLFSETMETYRLKAEIVASAEQYEVTAIACVEETGGTQLRIAAAQAADELLSVKDVEASFVIFTDGEGFSVSARSYGAINVQLVMEALGGGGHRTMAGAYVNTDNKAVALERLKQAIDGYLAERQHALEAEQSAQ